MSANKNFQEYVRDSSFTISLSNSQIKHLDMWAQFVDPNDISSAMRAKMVGNYNMATLNALVNKGFMAFVMDEGFHVTEEGFLAHKMLLAAGFCKDLEIEHVNSKEAS